MDSADDDLEREQAEILTIIKSRERRAGDEGARFNWNKMNRDLACRVVKEFLRKHIQGDAKVVGPNVYIEDCPTEFDLLLVAKDAIPAAFTNAYRNEEVRFVIEIKSRGYINPEFPSKLRTEFDAVCDRYKNVNCTYLTIRETRNPKQEASISYIRELKKVLAPKYQAFCLAESRTDEPIPGQWRQFVKHLTAMA